MTKAIPFSPSDLRKYCLMKTSKLVPDGQYTFIDNGANVLAVAHCDTVPHYPTFSRATLAGDRCYFSPAMDDRLGVYTILDVLPALGINVDVLLTTDEEMGVSTASLFRLPEGKHYNWMVEFDRRGAGVVFYQYEKTAIVDATKGIFTKEFGTFSDISSLDHLGIAGMNIGTGYYDEHSYKCHMIVDVWKAQVARFLRFYEQFKDTRFDYTYTPSKGGYTRGWSSYYDTEVYDPVTRAWVSKATTTYPKADATSAEWTGALAGTSSAESDRFLYLSDGRVDTDPSLEELYLEYIAQREHKRVPEGTVEFCADCGGNADYQINGVYTCERCDDEDWWGTTSRFYV